MISTNLIEIYLFDFENSPVSPMMISIVIGILFSNLTYPDISKSKNGFNYWMKYLLEHGINFLGIRLSLMDWLNYSSKGLIVVIPCTMTIFVLVQYLGKKFKINHNLCLLIAVGVSMYGATAIVVSAPSMKAKKSEMTYAMADITMFGLFAMVLYPILPKFLFNFDITSGSLFLGSSFHKIAQVIGSALMYSDQYSEPGMVSISTITKLLSNTLVLIVIPFSAHKTMSSDFNKS